MAIFNIIANDARGIGVAVIASTLLLSGCNSKTANALGINVAAQILADTVEAPVRAIVDEQLYRRDKMENDRLKEDLIREIKTVVAEQFAQREAYQCIGGESPEECRERLMPRIRYDAALYGAGWKKMYSECTTAVLLDESVEGVDFGTLSSARLNCMAGRGYAREVAALRRYVWS